MQNEMTAAIKQVGEKGVTNVIFAITIGFIVIFIAVGIIYIVLSDRLNGLDAYRTKTLFDAVKAQKETCDINNTHLQGITEWIRQQPKLTPPPDLMISKPCPALPTLEPQK